MTLSGEYEPSPEQWVRDQVEKYEASGGREANILRGNPEWPIVVITSRGAKSGKLRKNPVMRVEKDGVYAAVASKGGAPKHPTWYYNFLERIPRSTCRTAPSRTRTSRGSPRAPSGPSGGSAASPSTRRTPTTSRRPTARSRSSCSSASDPCVRWQGRGGRRGAIEAAERERGGLSEPGQPRSRGRATSRARQAPAEDDHLVRGERRGSEDVVVVGALDALGAPDLVPGQGVRGGGGRVQDLGPVTVSPDPGTPVGPERVREDLDQPVQCVLRVGGQLLDGLEVEEEVAAGGVPRDPEDADAVQRVARRHDRVGHRAGSGLEEHVVDRGAVGAVLDDLDRLDVAARLTDRGGDASQRPGDVRELDAQQERHATTIVPGGFREMSLSGGWLSARS